MAQQHIFKKFDQMSASLMTNRLTRIYLARTILGKLIYTEFIMSHGYSKKEKKKGKKWHAINEKIRIENYDLFQNNILQLDIWNQGKIYARFLDKHRKQHIKSICTLYLHVWKCSKKILPQ